MLSEHARQDWQAYADAIGNAGAEPDRLNRFLIGVHRRGEEFDAHELKSLLEATSLTTAAQAELISFISPALALLASYEQVLRVEEEWFDEEEMAGPGYLVI
ncbi:MAG: hypothetical protein M3N98_10625 [Actinomycetota bacterium]|nr:hypothetical protein [Actinomycetota bacterium]